jgi:hypothetical protein
LFSLIGTGATLLDQIMENEREEEGVVIEQLITKSLTFFECLLKHRKGKTNSPFEDALLAKLVGKKQVPLITAIFEFINYERSPASRVISCRVITLIAELTSSYQPRPPSLVSYLGENAEKLVERCLYRLKQVQRKLSRTKN